MRSISEILWAEALGANVTLTRLIGLQDFIVRHERQPLKQCHLRAKRSQITKRGTMESERVAPYKYHKVRRTS